MKNYLKFFCGALFLVCVGLFFANKDKTTNHDVDVLFFCYDLGDSNPMQRVMKELDKQGITYKVLALGKALEIFQSNALKLDLPDVKWDRSKILDATHIKLVENSINPKIVITGMASAVQAQVLNLFKKKQAYTIAFYDNFDTIETAEYVQDFLKTVGKIDEYFIPSETTLPGFQKLEQTKHSTLSVFGQPILENWDDVFSKTNKEELRQKLKVELQDQVLLFAGDYTDTYKEYFRIFVKGVRAFNSSNLKVFVTYHPKTDGSFEKSVVEEEKISNIRIIETKEFSTTEIATIANAFACHKSSMGIQALYVGLPVIYIVKSGEVRNFAIQQGIAEQVEKTDDLSAALDRILKAANRNQSPVQQNLGIPKNATARMVTHIKELLAKKM
jgi:hypothetical protein